jgi:hypothetical protein
MINPDSMNYLMREYASRVVARLEEHYIIVTSETFTQGDRDLLHAEVKKELISLSRDIVQSMKSLMLA